ncbi:hypothetical protein OpiT1DRAFT_00381 [Opitutaceae bacterium TAV1]|nr:hypothetical protein OpiT1DRAFT_00381 [Opitutaceae bacterium TAV1]
MRLNITHALCLLVAAATALVNAALPATTNDLNLNPDDCRYYGQREWGTPQFLLIRSGGDAGPLRLRASEAGVFTFYEDVMLARPTELRARIDGLTDNDQLRPYVMTQDGRRLTASRLACNGNNTWTLADFGFALRDHAFTGELDITAIGWEWKSPAPHAIDGPALADCVVLTAESHKYPLFTDNYPNRPDAPAASDATKNAQSSASDDVPRVFIAENTRLLSRPDWQATWIAWATREFPGQFGLDFNITRQTRTPAVVATYAHADIPAIFETHLSRSAGLATAHNRRLFATRHDGYSPNHPLRTDPQWAAAARNNALDTTHPDVFRLVRDDMLAVFDQGFSEYLIIDYVWPWFGGKWGYGDTAIAQWKTYLKDNPRSLSLVAPDAEWTFADYWSHFTSLPLTPATFGWENWEAFACGDEFAPPGPENARRLKLFNALWHYHHLAFLDRLGREAALHGGRLAISINPEDINNGTDLYLMSRLRHLHALGMEYFGSPRALNALSHTMPFLRTFRNRGGPRLDLIGEINGGGHGPSRYDRDTAFAFYYAATATALPSNYNNQYVESLWPELQKLNDAQRGRFDHWFAGAHAFLLRHAEEAETRHAPPPPPSVTVVASRSVLDYQPGSTNSLAQARNVASLVASLNIDFLQSGRDVWDPAATSASVLIWSPAVSTPGELAKLRTWIDTGSQRILIVHGGTPWRTDSSPEQVVQAPVLWREGRSYLENVKESDPPPPSAAFWPAPSVKRRQPIRLEGADTGADASVMMTTDLWLPDKENGGDVEILLENSPPPSSRGNPRESRLPLINRWRLRNGNQILQITPDLDARAGPGATSAADTAVRDISRSILEYALRAAGVDSFACRLPGWQIKRYPVAGGHVFTAWDQTILQQQERHRPRAYYDRAPLPGGAINLELQVQPGSDYLVYSIFGDAGEAGGPRVVRGDARGLLAVPLTHSCEVVYLGENTAAFRHVIQRAAEAHASVVRRTRVLPSVASSP